MARWTEGIDYVLTDAEHAALPAALRAHLDPFVWRGDDGRWYGSAGDSRFLNHAQHPNLAWNPTVQAMCAVRGIAPGEELTEHYGEFDRAFPEYAAMLV